MENDNMSNNSQQDLNTNNLDQSEHDNLAGNSEYRYAKDSIPYNNTESGNTQTGNVQSGNGQYSNAQYGNTQYGNTQYGNTQYGNTQYGNAQYNNAQYGNTQYGNTQYGSNTQYSNNPYQYNQYSNTQNAYGQTVTKAKKMKKKKDKGSSKGFFKNKVVRLVASALLFGIIAGSVILSMCYIGVTKLPGKFEKTYNISTVTPYNNSTTNSINQGETQNLGMNVEAVAQAALPAMVELSGTTKVSTGSSYGYDFWGGQRQQEATTSGSGIIVGKNDTELLVLTNAHVISGVSNIKCSFIDETEVDCSVKGSKSDKDIAVVAVDLKDIPDETISKIAIAELGESDDVVLGQEVVAIGNALGEGQSVTSGIVSALNRSITVDNVTFSGLFLTDAAINSGNSGGALLNEAGQVVGINFAKTAETGVEGMAYSIPVSNVRELIDSLMTREKRSIVSDSEASYLGIAGVDVTSSITQVYSDYPKGVLISQVQSGSAAEKAGLGQYDIISSFDDQTVSSMSGLQSIMRYYKAGETVKIEYYHMENNKYVLKSVDVTLGKKN